jgi:hypothetical protein
MAQTKKKRRRKHRGTQGGKVDTRPKGRPRNRAEAKQRAASRRTSGSGKRRAAAPAGPKPPTWGSAIGKGVAAGLIFFALLALAFGRPVSEALPLAGFMLAFYIPMSFLFDRFFYNRQISKMIAERRKQQQDDG